MDEEYVDYKGLEGDLQQRHAQYHALESTGKFRVKMVQMLPYVHKDDYDKAVEYIKSNSIDGYWNYKGEIK